MVDRLRVIEGDDRAKLHRGTRRVQTKDGTSMPFRAYECGSCSDAVGYSFQVLVRARLGAVKLGGEARGRGALVDLRQVLPAQVRNCDAVTGRG